LVHTEIERIRRNTKHVGRIHTRCCIYRRSYVLRCRNDLAGKKNAARKEPVDFSAADDCRSRFDDRFSDRMRL
jgi:hypothetical protein